MNNVEVDLDQQKLIALGLSAQDVSKALAQQDIVCFPQAIKDRRARLPETAMRSP